MKKNRFIKNINPLFLNGIAHRGLHNEFCSENGLKAFENAKNHHVPFELDVHLTLDHQLIIAHDEQLERMTNKKGIVEELNLDDIKNNYHLLDGEEIPTLKEVLDLINEEVPIVVELKVYKKNHKELAKKVLEELSVIKDKKNIMLISFDPRALRLVKKKGYMTSLLVTSEHEWTYIFRHFFDSLDLDKIMLKERRVQRYQKKHFVNAWTINSLSDLNECCPLVDTVTFEGISLEEVKKHLQKPNI